MRQRKGKNKMYKKVMQDMDKVTLLKMRDEEGMTLKEIARSVGCSTATISKIIGPMTPEERRKRQAQGGKNGSRTRWSEKTEGGYVAERKMQSFMPQREQEEPKRAVLVMKTIAPQPIPLHGEFMDYTISPDRKTVDVETDQGRCLMQIPVEKISLFIDELDAIRRNAASGQALPFWG